MLYYATTEEAPAWEGVTGAEQQEHLWCILLTRFFVT